MKITAYKPDINQEYENGFKHVYPYANIGRVVTNKDTGEILMELGENDSNLTKSGAPWSYDETKHDIMVKFPKFFYKREWVGEVLKDSILSEVPHTATTANGYEVFPVFLREDGTIRDYVLYGAFKGVELNGQLRSIIGYKPTHTKTIASFRSLARQGRNTNFNIEMYGMVSMIQLLYKVAFQDLNSQAVLGNGWTSKSASAITGSTMALGNRSGYLDPFSSSVDKPDSRLSTGFGVGENGELAFYNKKDSDPMPIKTRNMNGLQKWEETEDYIIYLDKDAVMTTVENYVVGAYDLFMERKANVDSNESLMKDYKIEWTEEDDSKLMLDTNNYLLSQPVTLEEDEVSPSLETKVVPTTYEACFRVDKKTKDVYVGEGYENLYDGDFTIPDCFEKEGDKYVVRVDPLLTSRWVNFIDTPTTYLAGQVNNYRSESHQLEVSDRLKERFVSVGFFGGSPGYITNSSTISQTFFYKENILTFGGTKKFDAVKNISSASHGLLTNVYWNMDENTPIDNITNGDCWFKVLKYMVTKTATEKPFVKTIMPNAKLALMSSCASDTHSFVMKDVVNLDAVDGRTWVLGLSSNPNVKEEVMSNGGAYSDVLVSSLFKRALKKDGGIGSVSLIQSLANIQTVFNITNGQLPERRVDTFKQLLIYKGNLTEARLLAENNKSITLIDNRFTSLEFPSNGNQISLFGIEDFYGSIWSFVDGMMVTDAGYHVTNNPVNFGGIAKHDLIPAIPLNDVKGFGKTLEKVSGKHKYMNMFNSIGATDSSNYSDYLWSHRAAQTYICRFGTNWFSGSYSGAFCLNLGNGASYTYVDGGARLVYLG
ncbi:MAG: hypothetical protein ACRC0Y_04145 [Fusobacteriaceae bacterium]